MTTPSRRITAGITAGLATLTTGCATETEPAAADPTRVVTTAGPVRGTAADGVLRFAGIRYAEAPVGERRWAAPVPAEPWTSELDATAPGKPCPQPLDQPIAVPDGDEDCLSLTVTAPAEPADARPVIVWIHGGSFTYGDGASYDATRFARQADAVVVAVNYRLGSLGFGGHPDPDTPVNLGIADQQLALEWVRDNAAAFGGDPGNVTLMGQSGGGYSVCAHLSAPGSAGLFHRAIIHSAGCVGSPDAAMDRDTAAANWQAMAAELGCDPTDLECLRGKSSDEIVTASEAGHEGFRIITGDSVVPSDPGQALRDGTAADVPVLYGSNRSEEVGRYAGMEAMTGEPLGVDDYTTTVTQQYGDRADAVTAAYPVDDYQAPGQALGAIATDANWSRPAWHTAQALAGEHTYMFEFDGPTPWYQGFGTPSYSVGADHMAELAYLFDYAIFNPLTEEQRALAGTMFGYWGAFARTGDPNHADAPRWEPFTDDSPAVLRIAPGDEGIAPVDFAAEHRVALWDDLLG